jgi:hypothetical protein
VASAFGGNPIAATPDGKQVWFTLKDVGKTTVLDAHAPFSVLKTIDSGPITNHVNFARNSRGTFAYVTVGGLNEVQVFRTDDFAKVSRRSPSESCHTDSGPRVMELESMSGSRMTSRASSTSLPRPNGEQSGRRQEGVTSVALFDQGLLRVLQASATGLEPGRSYVLALSRQPDGSGDLEPLAAFTANPAGSAIVNALGPIRQILQGERDVQRRYLVIAPGSTSKLGAAIQVQVR